MKDIRADLLKQMHDLATMYWDAEINDAHDIFREAPPSFNDWKLESKRAEAFMDWRAKADGAKLRKLALLKQLAQLQSGIAVDVEDPVQQAASGQAIIDFLSEARKRIGK